MLPLLFSLLAAAEVPTPQLVEGKFGTALNAAATPQAFGGDERYRTPPLTVECWAKLNSKRGFNVLVSSDPKNSSQHWEIYSYSGSGRFAAYLPGYSPSEIISKKVITDRQWHHLAMTFDGKIVTLFVDGRQVHQQAVKPSVGLKPEPGPLSIGQAIDGNQHIGCDGVLDDVRLSRVVRTIKGVPTEPHPVDADTVAVWRFDGSDKILADPAWTPPPSTTGEAWERETDPDWVDARLRQMDTGPTFNGTLAYPLGKSNQLVYKGTAIRLGDRGGAIFDRSQLRYTAAWTGGYLQHSDRRFGLLNTPTPAGKLLLALPTPSTTIPLPPDQGRYQGLYLHGDRVVLSYRLGNVEVLDSPSLESVSGKELFVRTLQIGPATRSIELPLGQPLGVQTVAGADPTSLVPRRNEQNEEVLLLRPSTTSRRLRVVYGSVAPGERETVLADLEKRISFPELSQWIKPGSARWGKPLVTRGQLAKDTAPYVVDTLTVPYVNPYKALMFTSGLDFLPDGRIAVCTAHGDVWLVTADDKLEKVTWQRFATGLYHPLGLKVIDGKIVVLERGQLTRLHDTNHDGEADWYENLCHDWHTGAGEHSYDSCLETDSAGNFYFFKTGDTHLPHGGCLMRVSKDGQKVEVYATGFRHPVGMGISPDDVVSGADQEGNWMPMTRVDLYKRGGFYGDMRAHHRATPPKLYDGPLVWLPKEVDNSAGGQAWVPHDRFGFPKGQMLHLSYGRCTLHALLIQKIGDVDQAGAVNLGVKFLSGAMRMRFHPTNGHLYVCGLRGWQTAATEDGCLQRVRYTGQPLPLPLGLTVTTAGLRLDFDQPLDPSAAQTTRYRVEQWNYRWTENYGSKRYSVKDPNRVGQDTLEIDQITFSKDGKSVLLHVKGLAPVMQMRISYDVQSVGGQRLTGAVHNTIHRVADESR